MKEILKLEFRKLRKQKGFYIAILWMSAMILAQLIVSKLLSVPDGMGGTTTALTFALDAYGNASFSIFAAILVALIVCDDYEQQILKNILSRGYSRNCFYFSKMIYVWAVTTILYVYIVCFSLVIGIVGYESDSNVGTFIGILLAQYVSVLAEIALYFAMSILIRKTGGSIAVNIVATLLLGSLLTLADTMLKLDSFHISDYWLTSFTSSLSNMNVSTSRLITCLIGSVIYMGAFGVIGFLRNRRTEI